MKKTTALIVIFLLFTVLLTACGEKNSTEPQNDSSKLVVYTTIYPLADFTANVGGEHVQVINLISPGAEPHSWEPSPRDIADLQNADLFIYCGAGLEPWVEQVISSLGEKGPIAIDSSRGIDLAHHESDNHHHGTDPHIWLDPIKAQQQVDNILAGLIKKDPENANYYRNKAAAYKDKLQELDEKYRERLADAPLKKFITSHEAFGYLADRYGLEQIAIRGLTPEMEPGPSRMAEIVSIARANNIKHIFFESLVNPKVSETIAEEIGGDTLVLNPISSLTEDEISRGKNYLTVMEDNLRNLEIALGVSDEY